MSESEGEVYQLTTLNDLLKVPAELRCACVRDILYALATHELAFGEQALTNEIGAMMWMDDGKHDLDIRDAAGTQVLSLRVTEPMA